MESDPEAYCREIEGYLCRKNDGHLIRVVGPAFERVSRWAGRGIPITVACAGIDRYFERYYRRGPRRRPVRIEFCEADVLDAFDDWRRAVGVMTQDTGSQPGEASENDDEADVGPRRRESLASHVGRVIARLTGLRGSTSLAAGVQARIEEVVRELDTLQGSAKHARGAPREALIERLADLDRGLIAAAFETLDDKARAEVETDAKDALGPFRDRMAPEAFQRARVAAAERFVKDRLGLPTIRF